MVEWVTYEHFSYWESETKWNRVQGHYTSIILDDELASDKLQAINWINGAISYR